MVGKKFEREREREEIQNIIINSLWRELKQKKNKHTELKFKKSRHLNFEQKKIHLTKEREREREKIKTRQLTT